MEKTLIEIREEKYLHEPKKHIRIGNFSELFEEFSKQSEVE